MSKSPIGIREVEGDILLSGAALIAHGVAPGDHFSEGLALSLREQWPSLYKDFRHFCQQTHPEPGGVWMWHGAGSAHVANLFTQDGGHEHGSRPGAAKIEYVNHALRELHKLCEKERYTSLALPRLATGVGRLDWNEVKPLIEKHLGALQIPIILYTSFKKGVKADERLA